MMKSWFFFMSLILISFSSNSNDKSDRWGTKDPELAQNIYRIYNEFYLFNKNYEKAYPRWSWLFKYAPKCDEKIYDGGVNIIKFMLEKGVNGYLRHELEDTLFMIFDQRIKYFGNEGKVLGLKAMELFERRLNSKYYDEIFDAAKGSVELEGNASRHEVLLIYFKMHLIEFKQKKIDQVELLKAISEVNEVVAYNVVQENKKTDQYKEVREEMINIAQKQKVLNSCETVKTAFMDSYEKYPEDIHLLQKFQYTLKKQHCREEIVFKSVSLDLYAKEQKDSIAFDIASFYFAINNVDSALIYAYPDLNCVLDSTWGKTAQYFIAVDRYENLKEISPEKEIIELQLSKLRLLLPKREEILEKGYEVGQQININLCDKTFTTNIKSQ